MSDGDQGDMVDVHEMLDSLKLLDRTRYDQVVWWIDEYLKEVEVLPESMRVAKKSS
jgi:hypothetical protein